MLNPLSLEAFTAWLQKHHPETPYQFDDPNNCLCHQYLRSAGFQVKAVVPSAWVDDTDKWHNLPEHWNEIARGTPEQWAEGMTKSQLWTFGAALARAKALK